nr:peptide-binding protein [Enterococcus avium]
MGNLGAQKAKRNDTPISAKKDIMGDKTVRVRADLHHIIKIETAKNGGNVKEVMDQALEEYIRNIYLTNFKRSENEMAVTYEKTFEIEIINELSASL